MKPRGRGRGAPGKLQEIRCRVSVAATTRPLLLVDASESAVEYRERAITLLNKLLSKLPADMQVRLGMLGRAELSLVERAGSAHPQLVNLYERGIDASSLLGPIMAKMGEELPSHIVVVGSGEIFDLEDWKDSEVGKLLLLVCVGESMQGEHPCFEELVSPEAHAVADLLVDPVISARIGGDGFLPTTWDSEKYRMEFAQGEAYLAAGEEDGVIHEHTLRFTCLVGGSGELEGCTAHRSGRRRTLPIETVDPLDAPSFPLSKEEQEVYGCASRGERFRCPRCGGEHSAATLVCENGPGFDLGIPVFKSIEARRRLREGKQRGIVLFRETRGAVDCMDDGRQAMLLGAKDTAVLQGSTCPIYQYDGAHGRWRKTKRLLKPYQEVQGGWRAVVI